MFSSKWWNLSFMVFFWASVQQLVKQNKFEKLLCIYPKPEVQFFPRTARLGFALINEVINMVRGHANLDVLDNLIYILLSVWVSCLDTKKGFFWGKKMFFQLKIFSFILFFRKFAKFSMRKHGKRNHDLDVECKSQGVFLQFWLFTFLSFH